MKPGIPKGTRDFSSADLSKRNYIFQTIRAAFELYGFEPIETPSFENSSTLMGKYGDEGDRLIFKILNSGDYLNKVDQELLIDKDLSKITPKISEKALRYDLTVPFARYVVQHQNELAFPFKRYQIQPVWRADRPQKGRFREFFQCDADVIGSESLWQEVEFVQLYDEVFSNLGLNSTDIRINNRKILAGIAEIIGAKDNLIDFTIALDKLDKIGVDGVEREMRSKGISDKALQQLQPLFLLSGSNLEKLEQLENLLSESEEGMKGIEELRFVFDQIENLGLKSSVLTLDLTLARGLNYYTGAIFEIKANGVEMGSIGGGGRYDDLTGIFGLKNMSGIGISFGLDRIFLVMEALDLFESKSQSGPEVLFLNFGETEALYGLTAIRQLRNQGIRSELYPDSSKVKRQMTYANKKNIPFVVFVGDQEMARDEYTLKNMNNGQQMACNLKELIRLIASEKS